MQAHILPAKFQLPRKLFNVLPSPLDLNFSTPSLRGRRFFLRGGGKIPMARPAQFQDAANWQFSRDANFMTLKHVWWRTSSEHGRAYSDPTPSFWTTSHNFGPATYSPPPCEAVFFGPAVFLCVSI